YQSLQDLLFDLAPIDAGFRKERVDRIAEKAASSLEAGDLDAAQKLLWQALELDPNHSASQELRRRIQRRRERLGVEERVQTAMYEAESLLRRNSYSEAIQVLDALRVSLGSDSVADLRTSVETRLAAAQEERAKAQRIGALLADARAAA